MYIKLPDLVRKYNLKLKGIIHVGGHEGEEYEDYKNCGVTSQVWVEPYAPAFEVLKSRLQNIPGIKLINCAFGAHDSDSETMFVAPVNLGMSSSLLEPGLHLQEHPDILFNERASIAVRRMDIFPWLADGTYNFLNMDVQGYELKVLQGGQETLKVIDYVYAEVNRAEVYKDCAKIEQIDEFLKDFSRVETFWCNGGMHGTWGDAFYVRKSLLAS